MVAAPIFYTCFTVAILFVMFKIISKPNSFLGTYWPVLIKVLGSIIFILGVTGFIKNMVSIKSFKAQNNFQPDNIGGLLFGAITIIGLVIMIFGNTAVRSKVRKNRKPEA